MIEDASGRSDGRFDVSAENPDRAADDRRIGSRRPVLRLGRVVLNGGTHAADCIIKDVSESGARLRFGEVMRLPEAFDLLIVEGQMVVPVVKVWHKGVDVGVSFSGAPRPGLLVQA